MDLSRLDGLPHAAPSALAPAYTTTGAELARRMESSSLRGLSGAEVNPMLIAAHNVDGVIYFESENGLFYDVNGTALNGLGSIFNKIGNAVADVTKTVTKSVVSATKVLTTPLRLPLNAAQNLIKGQSLKESINNAENKAKSEFKEFKTDLGNVIRLLNRFFLGTILLRNGILLSMKLNLFKVGEKLKYAYLTDAQAANNGIDPTSLSKVRGIEKTLSKIYVDAGGKAENLKRAILNGQGNSYKNGKLNFALPPATEYADSEEYRALEDKNAPADAQGQFQPGTNASAESKAAADKAMEYIRQYDAGLVDPYKPNAAMIANLAPVATAKITNAAINDNLKNKLLNLVASKTGVGELGDFGLSAGASIAAASGVVGSISGLLGKVGELVKSGKSIVDNGKSIVDKGKDAVSTVKALIPKKQPAPLSPSATDAETQAYIKAQQEYDEYAAAVQAAGGVIQADGTVKVGDDSILPEGKPGLSTGAKIGIALGGTAVLGSLAYLAFAPKPVPKVSLKANPSLSGLPNNSATVRKRTSSAKSKSRSRTKSKSKVKNVTI